MKAAGWIISPIISNLMKEGFSYLGFDTSKKLGQLEIKVLELELMLGLEAAQIYPHRNRLEPLLKNLRSAYYEAEDILDDVEYHRLKGQVQSHPCHRNWVHKIRSALPSCSFMKNQENGNMSDEAPSGISRKKLKKSLEKIENIINEAHRILPLLSLPNQGNVNKRQIVHANSRSPVTTATPPPVVIGREKDCDNIISMLHEHVSNVQPGSSNSVLCYSIIGIYGIAGSGKSTLAQLVCASEKKDKQEKKDGHFDLIMWVHVSQNFSVDTILTEMLEAATGKKCDRFNNLDTLEQKLEEALSGKRFLLVLDDIWYHNSENQHEQQKILTPLRVGKPGSKVLVTSRTEYALLALGALKCIPISDLDDNVFLKLFLHYALPLVNMDERDQRKLEVIGANIAKKLRRSPLAARTVGGQLQIRPNVDFWRDACNRDLLNETMGALWWSYQHLDEQVRRCFSYCSIFPRRHQLKRDELVNLWVAEGFISTTDTGEEEAAAQQYFGELVSSSFLNKHMGEYSSEKNVYFTVHDLLHDLAEKVAGSDCFRIQQDWAGVFPRNVRHLFIEAYDETIITERILEMENLRTLVIHCISRDMMDHETVYESIFMKLRKLRVLKVQSDALWRQYTGFSVLSLPASIKKLKHLRYFGYQSGYVYKLVLPSTISTLHHFQVLDFGNCMELVFSSEEDLSKLNSLRHVIVSPLFPLSIRHLGRLTSLQTMPPIKVERGEGYELQQLRRLNKLRGRLEIQGLENVESKEAAAEANLGAKECLQQLVLVWEDDNESCSPDVQEEVLEGLCPPMELESLEIKGYQGSRYPSWLVVQQNCGPNYLHELRLSGCSRMGSIPALTHLCSLTIFNCSWDSLPDDMERLTSIKNLTLSHCYNILLLPTLPKSLELLRVDGCSTELTSSCRTTGHPNWHKIKHIPRKYMGMVTCQMRLPLVFQRRN
ncbi:putative disease resistance protein RGA3 isoform X2 [Oryza glaberrima]|nr:putative disease resistance protein RGA3 isoform X2 [Oryza glaberrima]